MPRPAPLPLHAVVRWQTSRSVGLGQIVAHLGTDQVIVRAWLPTLAKEIRTTPDQLTALPDLQRAVDAAHKVAALFREGLS